MISAAHARDLVTFANVLADEKRLQILSLLGETPDGLSVGEIAGRIGLTLSALSRHLNLLKVAGIVVSEPRGKRQIYTIRREQYDVQAREFFAVAGHEIDPALN